ncbi:MAG: YihY family inner membrane protein [Candidatus Hydrogenedentota bacterium]|nr:MAG: YihY family inner membrane protein [Candidatus Hydrogenedentota bacterium]
MQPTADLWNKGVELFRLFREGNLSLSPRHVRVFVYPVRIGIRAFEEFFTDKCLQRASALAFASLLALVPVTAIFFIVLTRLEAFSEIQLRVEDFLFRNLVPARTDVISEYLTQYTQNVTLLGVFGIPTLFITAIFLFNTIEHTINDIWHAKQRRPFLSKFAAFWIVLTATPVLVFVSFYIAARLAIERLDVFSLKFLTYLLNWLAFWFAYQFIPYTPVRIRAAIVGAVVGGTLWELAKGGFNWYIANMTSFDKIYGSLGAVPVFLLWLYVTWLIVLFGAEVAYAVQYPRGKSSVGQDELANYLEFYSVRAMAEIVKRFNEAGDDAVNTMDHLKSVGIPAEVLGEILNRLSEKRLILYTEDKDYVLARQPSSITIHEIIEAVSDRRMLAPESAEDPISGRLKKTFREVAAGVDCALDGMNLQMLIDGSEK